MTNRPCFHLAIPVDDIVAAREFYGGVLGLSEGRSDTLWVDWNFYGHRVVTHQTADGSPDLRATTPSMTTGSRCRTSAPSSPTTTSTTSRTR
ncbi:hypothetical protein LP422_17690 [Janibacter limosus]|uniref:Uncharacterized protein n=1 Tax=Janibacter limosus TaxID=53458 RepID=A0AC61U2Q7_9MICO|nr:hypothetical protein [Janibacter limosus]UUZ44294.1 hypothetical protein LP422_17690 [Janibacter limosus]